jgi:UDP-N-acetylmuramyl pentapeptide phosphotransferase/UDP-N-acetylglucosamine-1-phosphate transferase
MQFGKIHGIALAVLGAILLGLQVMRYLTPTKAVREPTESSMPKVEHRTIPVAGILGILSLFAGAAIFVTRRRVDEPEVKHAVK